MQETTSRYELESTLLQIAGNYSWTWDLQARDLFSRIPSLNGEESLHPAERIKLLSEDDWNGLTNDAEFSALARAAHSNIPTPLHLRNETTVAYFSPEFGVSEMLPQYSGGLGVLAGDHLKAASDLRMPLIAVGLFYRDGFFQQALEDGRQRERYVTNNPRFLALTATPARVELALADRQVTARVWQANVGTTRLFLLDTDLDINDEYGRRVSDRLYSGDREQRMRQELLMGVGGVRAIRQLGYEPAKFHLNEGHAGFLALELLAEEVAKGLTLDEAVAAIRSRIVFTTHTPVPAGIDRFAPDLMRKYLGVWAKRYGVDLDELLKLGILPGGDDHFNMAAFCVRIAGRVNGVSRLHGEVSRAMFGEVPGGSEITSVTNGVHARTWVDPEMQTVFDDKLGNDWHLPSTETWAKVDSVTDDEIRTVFRSGRNRMIEMANSQLGEPTQLDPDALTIGFARRFATYKRADLLLSDLDPLIALINDDDRPVQFVFAGKAHPADEPGKGVLSNVVRFANDPASRGRFVFIPGYNMAVARAMYAGCDVWLNNPVRPREACGTSGEKAALNGGLNFSILDGWWDECFDGENGWAIASSAAEDPDQRDSEEAAHLYQVLGNEIAPLYYGRDGTAPSAEWLAKVRHNWKTLGPFVTASRMVKEYGERIYQVTPGP
ncbi:MAG: alpha-glucan family phosphorylase [Acidimicrobiia bacterium]|nr:alpha-glucan family phosphorylase [Acidimicrobiia bacterium]MDX2466185.1 alpha-glucan family phosphorylase [Acidimicrobiia bacterium]